MIIQKFALRILPETFYLLGVFFDWSLNSREIVGKDLGQEFFWGFVLGVLEGLINNFTPSSVQCKVHGWTTLTNVFFM